MKRYTTLAIVSLLLLSAFLGTTQAAMQSQQLALQKSVCRVVRRNPQAAGLLALATIGATVWGGHRLSEEYEKHQRNVVYAEAMAQPVITQELIHSGTLLPSALTTIIRQYLHQTFFDAEIKHYTPIALRHWDNDITIGLRPEFTFDDLRNFIARKTNKHINDVIIEIAGKRINSINDFNDVIRETQRGFDENNAPDTETILKTWAQRQKQHKVDVIKVIERL